MPNWAVGVLKIRGTKENITTFAKECITGVNGWKVESVDTENKTYTLGKNEEFHVKETDYSDAENLQILDVDGTHIEGTYRMFIAEDHIDWDFIKGKEEHVCLLHIEQAWGINVKDLVMLSKKYSIDFKIFAFEQGMMFNQDVEIVKGEIIRNQEINYESVDDYNWNCINPRLGG